MQPNAVIYPPNRPLERIIMQPQVPISDNYLFCLDSNSKGEFIFASSDVSGTGWYGSLFFCNGFSEALKLKYDFYINTSSTIGDAVFYRDDYVLLASDNKLLKLLQVDKTCCQFSEVFFVENEECTNKISIWNNSSKFVTATGTTVATWNTDNSILKNSREFRNCHSDFVTSVDTDKTNESIFFSASFDRKACLWDDRQPHPATVIYSNEFTSLNSISCDPSFPNHVAVGSAGGNIYLIDTREPRDFLSVYNCFKESVYRTKFCENGLLGVCGNLNVVMVFSCKGDKLSDVYVSTEHEEMVRGMCWYNEDLYTCGFDRKILKHVV